MASQSVSSKRELEGGGYYARPQQGQDNNPFREVEKKYQLHYDQEMTYSKGKLRGKKGKFSERPTDLSDVIDFRHFDEEASSMKAAELGVERRNVDVSTSPRKAVVAVYTMEKHPGFYFVREFLDEESVDEATLDIVTKYIEPPSNSNHTKRHGHFKGLWVAAQRGLYLSSDCGSRGDGCGDKGGGGDDCWSEVQSSTSARKILDKLRWVTLGPQYDWTNRVYKEDVPFTALPVKLKALAENLVKTLGVSDSYSADAALLNFYGAKDTLGGHRDDSEHDLSQPLVSMSLGCDAIFLLGQTTKNEKPTAMLVRSGDIIILSGLARKCYHGVPRIFSCGERSRKGEEEEDQLTVQSYLEKHRINISIRMVR